ncbi:MAG TPA: DUF5677 domain-containing protein [Longimicrobium sp.]
MIPPLPKSPKNDDAFEDERHLLGWLVARLSSGCRSDLQFDDLSTEMYLPLTTVLPLLRAQIVYGRSVYRLSAHGLSEAAYPLTRAMLEVWAEIEYLLADPAKAFPRAVENTVWTLLVIGAPPGKQRSDLDAAVVAAESEFPDAVKAIKRRFNRYKHHSGRGWSEIIRESCGEDVARLYAMLSWHTHAIAQNAVDITYEEGPNYIRETYNQVRPEGDAISDVCTFAVRALYGSWNAFYSVYGSLGKPRRPERTVA